MAKLYDTIEFVDDRLRGGIYPDHQLAKTFLVSQVFTDMDSIEVQPLTITRLIKAICANFLRVNGWRIARVLKDIGFLNTQKGDMLQFRKDWRWDFWNVKAERG